MRNLACVFLVPAAVLGGCASMAGSPVGLTPDGALQPCPSAPHCVSSQAADAEHQVQPLYLLDRDEATWKAVLQLLARQPRTTLVKVAPDYVHAEVISPWHVYTDDVELRRQPGTRRVDVRSSSRVGYYDFNVNRDRVEALRAALTDGGLLARRHP